MRERYDPERYQQRDETDVRCSAIAQRIGEPPNDGDLADDARQPERAVEITRASGVEAELCLQYEGEHRKPAVQPERPERVSAT